MSEGDSPFMLAQRGGFWGRYLDMATQRKYAEGALIYQQGEYADCFYFLTAGRVKVYVSRSDGSEKTLAFMEQGTAFGESACFDGLQHYASAVAVGPCELFVFHRDAVIGAMARNPQMISEVLRAQIRKQRLLMMHLESMSFLRVQARIAHILSRLTHDYGETLPGGRGKLLTLRLTQEELSNIVGTSRVTVSREIGVLVRQGILAKDKRKIIVLDEARLAQVATPS